jgi:hypothetical protein
MWCSMFQHHTSENNNEQVKYNKQNNKEHSELLTQFGDKHTYSGQEGNLL